MKAKLLPMDISNEACYQALKAHDTRFDGRFFVGVSSTGIYCRPICRVRLPKFENCHFHASAAAAEAAGFRPCLRCRPELAPGFSSSEASAKLARGAALMIEGGLEGIEARAGILSMAKRLGVSDRHLRRIFNSEFGVSPVQYAQTSRLLMAKRLLTDTRLEVAEVAFASGFSSVRRLNALFAERYHFSPTALRKRTGAECLSDQGLSFLLPYRPPYDWPRMLAFFAQRAVPDVEEVGQDSYCRSLSVGEVRGWIEVSQTAKLANKNTLKLTISPSLASYAQMLLTRVKQVFDIAADPEQIAATLGDLAFDAPGLRLPGAMDGFELSLRAILGQQVTVKAARTLATRFVHAFGEGMATPFSGVSRLFPTPQRVASLTRDDIGALGIVGARAEAMIAVARAVNAGELDFLTASDPHQLMDAFSAIKGIGPWTAAYIAMRALAWPDAWLPKDVALQNALGLPNTVAGWRAGELAAEAWRPWRSYAVLHLWQSLERVETSKDTK